MKHILIAVDENEERGVAQARTVHDLFDADTVRAHLFHDFMENPEGASVTQVGSVHRASSIFEDAGIEIEYHESSGSPAASIVETAEEIDCDLVCVSGRKQSPAGKALFGSVAQEVMLGTERPVLMCSAGDR